MTTKENLKREIETLTEEQFRLVADFIEFIKFRNHKQEPKVEKKLSDFYGVFKTTKPYPGKEEIRTIVAESLAQEIIDKQQS